MYLTKDEREELRSLSKEVFGTRNHWHKLLTKGQTVLRKNGFGDPIEPIKVGRKGKVLKKTEQVYYNLEGIKEIMLNLKAKKEELLAKIRNEANSKAE